LVQNDGNDVATVAGMVEPAVPEASSGLTAGPNLAAWLNLSHELRTPAIAILGQAELLASGGGGPMSADMRAGIGTIQAAGRALLGRIEQLIRLGEELRMAASPMPDASAGPAPDASEAADLVALIRAGWTGGGLQVRPDDATLPLALPSLWLTVLASIIADLPSASASSARTAGAGADWWLDVTDGPHSELALSAPAIDCLPAAHLEMIRTLSTLVGARALGEGTALTLQWPADADAPADS
jgi:hypothetical protein